MFKDIRKANKIGFAFSGGAALGMAHIGALKIVEENNIKPEIISGTSAGAIIGAMFAKGLSAEDIEKIALSIDFKKTVNLLTPSLQRGALVDDKNVISFLKEHLGDINIEDLPIEFITSSVDLRSGNLLYIYKGNLIDAVRASISVPGIFLPYQKYEMLFTDGGLRDNLPIRVLRERNSDFIIGFNLFKTSLLNKKGEFINLKEKLKVKESSKDENIFEKLIDVVKNANIFQKTNIPRMTKTGYHSLEILITELTKKEIEIVKPELLIDLDVSSLKLWEFWRAKEAISSGYEQTKAQIQEYFNQL